MGLKDGLPSLEIHTATLSGNTVEGTSAVFGAGEIGATELASSSVTTAKIASEAVTSPKQAVISTGSPPAYGNIVRFGTGATSAGSVLWAVYGDAFKASPNVVVSSQGDTALTVSVGSIGTGSFLAISQGGASVNFNWIACGSG